MSDAPLKAPFPWFGGKRRVAPLVWERFGNTNNYIEPFFGSGAVLLGRPHEPGIETVNDLDGFVCNAWRAIAAAPDDVAHWADWPSNENDLHARHVWLKARRAALSARLEGDPDYYDAKIAGWWLWGMAEWIGGGFCAKPGPWQVVESEGVKRQLARVGDGKHGVTRQLAHLGRPGGGVRRERSELEEWMRSLAARLRRVRVACGDWSRICGFAPTTHNGLTAVFLDPPYSLEAGRDMNLYAHEDGAVAHDVREWALANGDNPLLRIALCGYDTEHAMPDTWQAVRWKAVGGYANRGTGPGKGNAEREVVWFSPYCLRPERPPSLFDEWRET